MDEPTVKKPSISTKALLGNVVKNRMGEELGKIDEVLLDQEGGFVSNLILSTGGLPGLKKRIAVPWDMLQLDTTTQALILDIDKDFIQRIPKYQSE